MDTRDPLSAIDKNTQQTDQEKEKQKDKLGCSK